MATKKKKRIPRKRALKKRAPKKRAPCKRAAKRKVSVKGAKRKRSVKARVSGKRKEKVIGQITHYFPKVRAAVIKLKAPLSSGDSIKIKGHTTNFQQGVTSMQIDHVPIDQAKKGQEIGLLVNSRVRQHDMVYKA